MQIVLPSSVKFCWCHSDITLGEQREPDPLQFRSQLSNHYNISLTGNLFYADGIASNNSLSEEDSDVSVEPIFDNHHFPDLQQTYLNREYMYNTVVPRYIYISFFNY